MALWEGVSSFFFPEVWPQILCFNSFPFCVAFNSFKYLLKLQRGGWGVGGGGGDEGVKILFIYIFWTSFFQGFPVQRGWFEWGPDEKKKQHKKHY